MVVSLSESDMLNGAVVPHSLAGKLAHLHFQILKCCSPASLVQWKNTRSANQRDYYFSCVRFWESISPLLQGCSSNPSLVQTTALQIPIFCCKFTFPRFQICANVVTSQPSNQKSLGSTHCTDVKEQKKYFMTKHVELSKYNN